MRIKALDPWVDTALKIGAMILGLAMIPSIVGMLDRLYTWAFATPVPVQLMSQKALAAMDQWQLDKALRADLQRYTLQGAIDISVPWKDPVSGRARHIVTLKLTALDDRDILRLIKTWEGRMDCIVRVQDLTITQRHALTSQYLAAMAQGGAEPLFEASIMMEVWHAPSATE